MPGRCPSRRATSSATASELAKITSDDRRAIASAARSSGPNRALNPLRLTRPLMRTGTRVSGRVTPATAYPWKSHASTMSNRSRRQSRMNVITRRRPSGRAAAGVSESRRLAPMAWTWAPAATARSALGVQSPNSTKLTSNRSRGRRSASRIICRSAPPTVSEAGYRTRSRRPAGDPPSEWGIPLRIRWRLGPGSATTAHPSDGPWWPTGHSMCFVIRTLPRERQVDDVLEVRLGRVVDTLPLNDDARYVPPPGTQDATRGTWAPGCTMTLMTLM